MSAASESDATESDSDLARRIRLGGWIGMTLLLGAFALRLGDVLSGTSLVYVVLNVSGALLVGVQCAMQRAWPALVLELGWVVLTLASLGVEA
jgi:hypothetical protein